MHKCYLPCFWVYRNKLQHTHTKKYIFYYCIFFLIFRSKKKIIYKNTGSSIWNSSNEIGGILGGLERDSWYWNQLFNFHICVVDFFFYTEPWTIEERCRTEILRWQISCPKVRLSVLFKCSNDYILTLRESQVEIILQS